MAPKKTVTERGEHQGHPDGRRGSASDDAGEDNTARLSPHTESSYHFNAEHFVTTFMQSFAQSQAEVNRSLIESLRATTLADSRSSAMVSPMSNASGSGATAATSGNFSRCTARFDGRTRDPEILEAFLDAIETYKECTAISDEHAVKGLSMLLEGEAAVWWRGVKKSVVTWRDAAARLRAMYGAPRPAHELLREMFAVEQQEERAEAFICRVRALIVRLPYVVPEALQVDIIYGLLHRRVRKRILRDGLDSVDCLLEKARNAEDAICQLKRSIPAVSNDAAAARFSSENRSIFSSRGTEGSISRANSDGSNDSFNYSSKRNYVRNKSNDSDNCHPKTVATVTDNKAVGTISSTPDKSSRGDNEPIRCYGCGKQGVVRSKCDNCSKSSSFKHVVEFNYSNVVCNSEVSSHPILTIGIFGREGVAIADTGATHSIASPTLYKVLVSENVSFQNEQRTLRLADGSQQVRDVLTADVPVTIQGRDFVANFMVIPGGKTKTLLGFDFLSKAGVVLDGSRRFWNFSDEPGRRFAFVRKYRLSSGNSQPADDCSLRYAAVRSAMRTPGDVRNEQLKDPEVRKIIEDLETDHVQFRGRQWSDRGYVVSNGTLFRFIACLVVPKHERARMKECDEYRRPVSEYELEVDDTRSAVRKRRKRGRRPRRADTQTK